MEKSQEYVQIVFRSADKLIGLAAMIISYYAQMEYLKEHSLYHAIHFLIYKIKEQVALTERPVNTSVSQSQRTKHFIHSLAKVRFLTAAMWNITSHFCDQLALMSAQSL